MRRIRLGAEPVEEQVDRLRRTTWALSAVASGIATILLGLFTAFGAPVVGLVVGGGLAAPIVAMAWLAFHATRRKAEAYLAERRAREGARPDGGALPS